jgi:prepilin-type N-terminal cleavage/methylation domain-containing protein
MRRGFTLIEVLVAMALLAIMLSALYGTFFVATEAVTTSGDSLLRMHEARTALDLLRIEAEGAITQESLEILDRDFYGEPSSEIRFATYSSLFYKPGRISYYVKDNDGTLVLMKRTSRLNSALEHGTEAEALQEVESFLVEAWDGGVWRRVWSENTLPHELRFTIRIPVGGQVMELSSIAKLRVGRRI